VRHDEYARHDATALAKLIRDKQVTAAEVLEAAIARAEAVNGTLNAIVRPLYDDARAARPDPHAPFAGVPLVVKDHTAAVAGHPTTHGSALLADMVATRDHEMVSRFRRAGLVPFAKTNTPELGILPTTEPTMFGPTKNPFALDRSTGGSSGGSAAAVAAGIAPVGHANDGGGSIRIPAACCGLFGLKPTRGRNPQAGELGDNPLNHEHVVTRSVRDSAAMLDQTCGIYLGAPFDAPPRIRPFADEVGAPVGRLKIAFSTKAITGSKIDPEVDAAVRKTAKQLEALGHAVEERDLAVPQQEMVSQWFMTIYTVGVLTQLDGFASVHGIPFDATKLEPLTLAMYESAKMMPLSTVLLANAFLQRTARAVAENFVDHDVWLTPVLTRPPEQLGFFANTPDFPLGPLFAAGDYAVFTPLFNVTGAPAMSVPLHMSSGGLPIGMHFVGRFGDEATLIRLAAQLEAAHPWVDRLPLTKTF
jgi:amidase